ncbi:MAG: sulfotransferase [Planctomycetaceae bacterium]
MSPESNPKTRFLFIGGSARSGTTLVQKILCTHSLIAGGPEFDQLTPLMQMYDRMRQPVRLERQAWYYSADDLANSVRTFVDSLFENVRARHPGIEIVSEKTPSNIAVARTLLELFPTSRFLNVQRDGRDVLYSHKKVKDRFIKEHGNKATPWLDDFKTGVVCGHWKLNAEQARQVEQNAPEAIRQRFMTVKYEELVAQPVEHIDRICQFVGISPEPLMLTPEEVDPTETGQVTNIDNVWYTQAQFSQKFNTGSVGSWEQGLSWWEKLSANLRMAPELERLGYEVPGIYKTMRGLLDRLRGRKN